MYLRNHPLVSYGGYRSWPPVWTPASAAAQTIPNLRGEVGVLTELRYYQERQGRIIYLLNDYNGEMYVGCLIIDDILFCEQLAERLRGECGKTIDAIGSLENSCP
jgi:hypothetical protein